jgi:hypothetical protein
VKHVRHGAEIAGGYGPNRVPLRAEFVPCNQEG